MRRVFEFLRGHIISVIIFIVVMAGISSALYIWKSSGGDVEPSDEDEQIEYVDSDTVYLAMERTGSLNPYTSGSEDVYHISQLLYSSLFRLDRNLSPVPDIVASYSTDAEKGTVTVQLRDNVKFSDGSSLTAYDVRSSVRNIQEEGVNCPYYTYVSKIDRVKVNDDHHLKIYFDSASDAAIDNLVFPLVPGKSYDRRSNTVIGSGPYRYASYDIYKSLTLVPNENYFGRIPKNKVEIKVLPDKSKALSLMEIDNITAYIAKFQDADMVAEDMKLKASPIISSEAEYLGFNFKNYLLSRREMRQAIAYDIDTASIIRDNYGGAAVNSDSIYFPGYLGIENKGDPYAYDQSRALKMLKNMGYRDSNEDGILEDVDGKILDLSIIVGNNSKSRIDSAKAVSNGLKQIGIASSVKVLSPNEFQKALKDREYDIFFGGYNFDKQYNLKKLFEIDNVLSYNNYVVLDLTKRLETALTAEEQKETYSQLHSLLMEEIPYYCLCYKTYSFMTVAHFEGEDLPTFFDYFRGCGSWQWKKARQTEPPER